MRTKDINLQINNIIRKDIIASAEREIFERIRLSGNSF